MANNIIKGRKGGGSKQRTPTEQPDDLQSVAKAKILLALGEGEFAGGLTGKDIYLDGTPLENADGSQNFSGVSWEFRPGTQAQTYIQGIPGTENEISVGTEVSSKTAWTHTFTNTQLSAVRVRLKWPSLMKQEDDGDVVGNTVKYAIDLQTDGGAWQTVLETAVTGKTTSGYERSHRIDLPHAGSTWTLRLRKISPDANSVKVGDVMTLQSYTEVIDAKLRYPNTALLYIEFDSSQFNGSIPQISCEPRGRVIRVPDNYNPETREYTGVWTGGFKWAWTDNPAWIYYDIVTADRFGLGNRLSSANISKWTLYQIAQYCDQLVPDGRGGDGMEPRYTCNVYVQERNDAYTVLRDFAAIFRGMTCWNGEQIVVQADMPRDVDFTYTRTNIVGKPRYSSSSSQVRYTNALVSWSDPDNAYADAMEPAFIPELVSRYSFNQLEMTAIGCTRQSEAHRKGLWGILTNNKDRVVEFDVGLDGRIPQPGYIIALADELLAGRVNGGRISAVNGRVITLDRDVDAKPGDRLQLNLPSGISQSRTIQAVNGRRQITVTTAYSETPERECVWAVESNDLFLQQYRVTGVKENGDATLTITGVSHDPDKFARIDTGAIIDQRPVSVLPAGNQSPPDDIVITSRSVVNQGISVETMQVNWSAVSGAIAYEAQWRRNDGNWINVPRSSTTSFEVSGIYAGRYLVRVRAINAAEISSGWAYSEEKTLTGKVGEPLAPLALATRSLVHGVQVSWEFPTGSRDTLRTELQYSKNQDGSAPMPLSDVAYPGKSYQQMGLSMGAEFWYRARLVDRLGNESPWTGWVQGMASDNFDDYYENLTDAIKDTAAWEETQRTISETQEGIRNTQQELEQTAEALRKEAEDQAKQVSQDIDASAKSITADVDGKISAVNKTITDEITSVNEALDSGLAQANKGVQEAKSAVADANKQIATVNKSLTDSITQVRQSVTDTAAEINATIDLEIARVSKTLADGDAALNAQIKTAENGLKQSLSQVNTTLTNAVKQETADRIADVNAKAAQAADELLAATQGIEASIESLTQVMKTADENLAREMSSLAAGANIQFDSQVIWHFNNQTTEGWTGSAGVPGVSQDGWLRPADSATDPYITSPGGLAVDGAAYRFIMLRFRKTGKPVWAGEIRWVSAGENFNNTKRYIVAEPEYADGVATLTVRDIPWTGNIDRIRLDLTNQQDASNFIEFDWIAVGRPAPGASTAALQDVRSTLSNALTAEAQARSTLAAQMRGSYDGSDLEKVTSGLLYQEKTARVTAISAEVKARESLQTQFNDNKAAVSGELSSLTTEQSAQASRIGGLETSLGKKADAAALTSLTQKVEQQGATLTSQGAALTSLTNRVGQTETGLAGTNEALSGLQSVVTQHGDRITSQGQSITKLTSDLGMTNAALAKKAEAAAVTALTQQVEQNGRDIRSNTDSITSLSNQLVNGQPNRWSRRLYPVQLANAGTVPSFSDVRAVAPTVVDEVADAAKLDFTSAGSYLIALYSCQVKVAADTTITLAPGARVFDDTGAIFVNGVQVAWGNASWTTVSFDLKAGWNTVEFLVNQWTGQAYINLGLKLSDKVAEMYSGLGVSALANAAGVLSSNVSQIGNDVVSNSQSITQLRNALTQTDANVASKADQTAMNSLTGRVEKTESGLTAANANITSLKSAVRAGNASGGDLIPNPTFDPTYDQMGFSVVSTTAEDVPSGCPYGYAARIASRDHHPNFAAFPATLNDVIEISALVACGAGTANFNLYVGTAVRPDTSTGAPLMAGGGKSPSATWQRTTWRFKVTQAMVDRGYIRPFLQISQNSPYGTVWFVTDWHMRNVTAAQKVQDTADATAAAVDSLTTTVTQQGNLLTSTGNRTTQLENGLATTNAAVAKKADATAVQDLTNTVKQLGNDLTAANSAITKLTGNLANTDKALAQKADATALATLDTKVTQQGKTLESQSNSLTNLSNSLSQVAADIDASGQIPGNLVVNPSFERGLDGYIVQSAAASVVETSTPHGGTRALRVGVGYVSPGQYVSFVQGRTYEIGVWVKDLGATTDNGAGNNKLRIGNSAGQPVFERPYNSGTIGSDWTLISGRWKATETAKLPVTLSNGLTAGSRCFDDFYVIDVTDSVKIDANASALSSLQNTVTQQGKDIASQSTSITDLKNNLDTTNANVAKKADAAALQTLQNTVTQQGKDIASASSSITSLQNNLSTTNANVAKKADATALSSLQNTVTQQGKDISASNSSIANLQASINRRTVFTVTSRGIGPSVKDGVFDESGNKLVSPGRSYTMITFKVNSDNSTSIDTSKTYDVFGSANNGKTMSDDIAALANGTYVCVLTYDEPAGNRASILAAMELLGGTAEVLNSLPYRGAYILLGRKGMKAGDGLELRAPTGGAADSYISTSVEFVNGIMSGLGAGGGVMMKADANASAISTLQNTVTQQGKDITSASSQITALQNNLNTTNSNVSKKADSTALNALQNTVTSQGDALTSQGNRVTLLENTLTVGDNIVPNSAMLNNAQGWGGHATTVDGYPAVIDTAAWAPTSPKFSVTPGDILDFSLLCLAGVAINGLAWGIRFDGPSLTNDSVYVEALNYAAGEKKVVTGTITVPAGATTGYLQPYSRNAITLTIYNIKVTRRNAGTIANAKAIADLTNEVTQQGKDITSASSDISLLKNSLATTDANVAKKADSSTLSSLQSAVTQQGKDLSSVGNRTTNLENNLKTTDANVSKKADASAVDSLQNTVTQQGKDIASQSTSITDLKNNLDTTNANVAKKADAAALQTLQNTVTQQGKDIASASSSITSLQNNLNTTNSNVSKKADSTALNALQNTVTQQGSSISSQGNSITQLKNNVDSLSIGASNLLRNSDKSGAPALCLSPTSGFTSYELKAIASLVGKNIAVKTQYTMTLWFKEYADGFGTTKPFSSAVIGRSAVGADSWSLRYYSQNGIVTRDGDLYKWVGTITAESGSTLFVGVAGLRFLFEDKSQKTGCQIYQVKLEEGNKGTSWSPASEDLSDAISGNSQALSSLDSRVTKAEGSITSQGNSITQLQNELTATNANVSKKADASALASLQNTVTQQGKDITSASSNISLLKNSLATTDANVAKKADSSALSSLQSTVNQQGTSISSIGNRTTSLENGLSTAQNNIAKKADASALQDLRNTVTSQGGDLTAANSSITSLQASMNRRTVFTVTARGLGNSVTPGVFDESGKNLFSPGRSWALVTFAKQSDGSAVIATSKTYDVFGSANNGDTMSADIGALTSGTYVCVLTFDEPSGNRGKILSALESLGGTSEVVNSLPYRGAYILLGRKGMRSGDGLELRAPTGGDATAHISTSVEFVNGIMMGLGAAGGVMMKADANASAITTLQNTVKTQGGNIDSLSSSITALENSLRSTNDTVSKKADTTAVSSLTGRVSQVENTITSQSQSITSLTSSINTISTQGANPWVDGTFESYGDGHVLGGGGTAVVVASQKFTGNKSLQVSRGANDNGNSDKQLGSWQSVREDAKFRFEFWAMMPADQAPSSGWTTLVGINSLNAAGQNSWQSAVTVSEAALGARDKWVKFTGIASNNGGGRTRAVVWISTRGASGSGTPGYSLYIDDLVITDVTDAKAAQDASDATASAVSGLTARVTDAEGKITAQAQQQTALATKVDNANSRVDNMAKTLSDSQSTQASLNTSLQSQIDAQAAANIKNQTTLDNTIKSVASITSTQQTHATALEALATQQTTLTSSVGDLSASVQNTAKTVADVNGTVSSLWSMKVETVNGKNVGAGITLGSNGETSDMILYADRFSLFNRNNATAVPVMVAEGNELYIDTARIKNSSLTSTKIADGSITNAKIGNEIRSNDFVDGSRGWRIAKDGSSQFNNVIVRGAVYATDGWFQGTVYANHIEGDIGSFAINIAQHRTRKVPKATWQWFELARFRRQNFDQVINIRGGLLQTDSITIDGGAKLRAGMSYAPGADGGLNPGYLSYAMLLRGTGATSGGGSMELGIELMYETGGATRLLTAQESMNVDNMSFVVPAGTGDAVLRYGCYLDRNGQMVLTILSRFDAFAARNNNVIRGSST
ncbi:TipJ family phage tail tip protein [Klebsiella pneumoniae]|uniref:TipJ family phage tail tip protein n=1 Tax=Klebsiella pneumoniae TaxID=573 RepID=UPI0022E8C9D1|nr:interleukin-like EMT inducer domain-containing protein [Klebsiella pneumoniae]